MAKKKDRNKIIHSQHIQYSNNGNILFITITFTYTHTHTPQQEEEEEEETRCPQ